MNWKQSKKNWYQLLIFQNLNNPFKTKNYEQFQEYKKFFLLESGPI